MNLNFRINCPRNILCCGKKPNKTSDLFNLDNDNNLNIKISLSEEISVEDQLELIRSTVLSHIKEIKQLDNGNRVKIEYITPANNKLIVSFDTEDIYDFSVLQEFEHNQWVGIKYNETHNGQTTKLFFKLIQSTTWHNLRGNAPLNGDYQRMVSNPFIPGQIINPKKDIFYIEKSWTDYKKASRNTLLILATCVGIAYYGYGLKMVIDLMVDLNLEVNNNSIAVIILGVLAIGSICFFLFSLFQALKLAGIVSTTPQDRQRDAHVLLAQFV